MNSLKHMKLASKTATVIGILLFILFTILISITVFLTSSALTTAADAQFNLMSEKNALNVQMPFDSATALATDLQYYVETKYKEYDKLSATDPKKTETQAGALYKQPMEAFSVEMEDYMINTISAAVENNTDIMAAGVFFEPFAYDSAIKDYSLYISVDNPSNYQSFGSYEEYKEASYYKTASQTQQPFYTQPYEYEGIYMISASYPILFDGELKGVVCVDINVSNFTKIMATDSRYPSLYQDILTHDGTIVFDSTTPNGDYVGVNLGDWLTAESNQIMQAKFAENKQFYMKDRNATGAKIERYFYPINAGTQTWWALTGVDTAEKNAATNTTVMVLLLLSIGALIIIIISTVFTLRKMIHPIKAVVAAAESISAGNFDISLVSDSEDEIGELTKSFSKTANTLKIVILDISKVLNEMSAGNLTTKPNAEYTGDLKQIEESTNNILLNLNSVLKNIKDSSQQVSDSSSNIAQGAQSLAEGATDQASSIEELQATITDIAAQVEQNAQNAKIADQMAHTAGQELQEGNRQMNHMLEAMKEISEASNAIQEVITTIEDIARQTNLLSLNASIEAARAGDAGKGFAVVADQVGKLASESAEATKATSNLIQASMQAVENGIAIADQTAQTIEKSVSKVQDVVENVAKISAANSNQAAALDQITQGVEQISCVIEENSAMAEESASSSEELSAQAVILDELVTQFNLNV